MKILLTSVCLFGAVELSRAADEALPPLMPLPQSVQVHDGRFVLPAHLSVGLVGHDDARLRAGITRALDRIQARTALPWQLTPSGGYAFASADGAPLVVEVQAAGPQIPEFGQDENYALAITPAHARLRAATDAGALRGLETLVQLLAGEANGWYLPVIEIHDAPRFPWRGLLIDACRHWMPVEVIKRNLDAMAAVKLNVLHWHLTEDQGFRVESKRYPKLQELGSDGLYYTQAQIRDVVAYAADRGIRVVPEFDIPGHATSWAVAYPELASAPGPYQLIRDGGIFDAVLDPTREETYAFLDGFFAEVVELFPDPYVHIGGDENNGKQWSANPQIQAFIAAHHLGDNAGLHAYFNRRVRELLAKRGRKLVGWDEILHPELPVDSVVQSWRGANGVVAAAKAGHPVLLSHGYYLDHADTAAAYYRNDPLPANTALSPEERQRVIGGEACMWAEWVSAETIDGRIWPRAAVVAERLWSPQAVDDVDAMYRRLPFISQQLSEAGARHLENRRAMLRRLAGASVDERQLEALVGVAAWCEYRGRGSGTVDLRPPLTRLVDCTELESLPARDFAEAVSRYLRDRQERNAAVLRQTLTDWTAIAAAAKPDLSVSPGLREVPIATAALAESARLGTEALDALATGKPAATGWAGPRLAALAGLKTGNPAGLGFPFAAAVERLVKAAAANRVPASGSR